MQDILHSHLDADGRDSLGTNCCAGDCCGIRAALKAFALRSPPALSLPALVPGRRLLPVVDAVPELDLVRRGDAWNAPAMYTAK